MCVNEDKILRMKDLIKALTEADIASTGMMILS